VKPKVTFAAELEVAPLSAFATLLFFLTYYSIAFHSLDEFFCDSVGKEGLPLKRFDNPSPHATVCSNVV